MCDSKLLCILVHELSFVDIFPYTTEESQFFRVRCGGGKGIRTVWNFQKKKNGFGKRASGATMLWFRNYVCSFWLAVPVAIAHKIFLREDVNMTKHQFRTCGGGVL